MLKRFWIYLFGPKEVPQGQSLLQSENKFLRSQIEKLQETIERLTTKPALKVSSPDSFRPKKFDPITKTLIPKTDEEIYSDMQGLKELGIL